MVTDSLISAADVEAERDVILDEIAMHDDDPDDVVHNLFAAQAWGAGPLGRPIAGTAESIGGLTRAQVQRFYRRHYRPANMVVAVAGAVDHARLVRQVRRAFSRNDFLSGDEAPVAARAEDHARRVRAGTVSARRPLEQVNLVLGVNGLTRTDDRRFALGVLNTALGGGTSSRLFQEVRERRGLAYSVFSFASHHADAGLVGVSVGCLPGKLDDVLATVRAELAKVAADGITQEELDRGKGQLKGGLVLGSRGLGCPDVTAGQGGAGLRRAAEHRRGHRAGRRRHARRRARDQLGPVLAARDPRHRRTGCGLVVGSMGEGWLSAHRVSTRRSRPRELGRAARSTTVDEVHGAARRHRLPMMPTTEGAFWSTTDTRNPPAVSAAEAFSTMLGTSSGRLAS